MKKENLFSGLITLVVGFIMFYLFLPAINIHSLGFWVFLIFLIFIYAFTASIFSLIKKRSVKVTVGPFKIFVGAFILVCAFITITDIACSPIFNSKSYSKRIDIITDKEFVDDIEEVDFSKLPLLDKDSSTKLGDRTVGRMPEMVSQYYVSDLYTQINYDGEIVRVTPLEYMVSSNG